MSLPLLFICHGFSYFALDGYWQLELYLEGFTAQKENEVQIKLRVNLSQTEPE